MAFKQKDLLGLRTLTGVEIDEILHTAKLMKNLLQQDKKKISHLKGKSVITLFYENSTRTRLSFELASKYMGSISANISASASSVAKGETLVDTGKTLDRMGADIIIIRHPLAGSPHLLAKHIQARVINGGDGMNEHPTQALLDMMTIWEKKKTITGLKIAIIGDISHSRVARSNIWGLTRMDNEVWVAGPSTLLPPEINKAGVRVTTKVEEAIQDADVIMGLRIQKERQHKGLFPSVREYVKYFGITQERLALAKENAIIMHPGPMNRGVEIASEAADCAASVIEEQVTNGVAVRMALLYLMTRRSESYEDVHTRRDAN